jgi:hypothetical protein
MWVQLPFVWMQPPFTAKEIESAMVVAARDAGSAQSEGERLTTPARIRHVCGRWAYTVFRLRNTSAGQMTQASSSPLLTGTQSRSKGSRLRR